MNDALDWDGWVRMLALLWLTWEFGITARDGWDAYCRDYLHKGWCWPWYWRRRRPETNGRWRTDLMVPVVFAVLTLISVLSALALLLGGYPGARQFVTVLLAALVVAMRLLRMSVMYERRMGAERAVTAAERHEVATAGQEAATAGQEAATGRMEEAMRDRP